MLAVFCTVIGASVINLMKTVKEINHWGWGGMASTDACYSMSDSTMDQCKRRFFTKESYLKKHVMIGTRPNPAIAPETLSLNAEKSAAIKITATRETFWTQMIKFPAPMKQFLSAMVS